MCNAGMEHLTLLPTESPRTKGKLLEYSERLGKHCDNENQRHAGETHTMVFHSGHAPHLTIQEQCQASPELGVELGEASKVPFRVARLSLAPTTQTLLTVTA